MKEFNPEDFPNLLPEIKLTSTEIAEQVSRYKLTFSQERNPTVEWGLQLPMFVDSFYDYVVRFQKIPDQEESYSYYLQFNEEFFYELNRPELMSGIKARHHRTYPSLVRDVHFNKFLEERISQCKIIYNTKLDIEEGIDLMILSRLKYGICFFTRTQRAFFARQKKENRHTLFDDIEYVEMDIEFKGSVKVGDFFLYGEREYRQLLTLLKNQYGKKQR